MKYDKFKGKNTLYIIYKDKTRYYAEMRPLNVWQYFRERISDYIGNSHIHPVYYKNRYFSSHFSLLNDIIESDNNK